jgi:hypothetical protein
MYSVNAASAAGLASRSSVSPKFSGAAVQKALQTFNTWAFKREQPSDLKLLSAVISKAMERHQPIPFVLYWGKGPRSAIDAPDLHCLDYLVSMGQRVSGAHPRGASFTLIFTDTHALHNGHALHNIQSYCSEVAQAARERSMKTCWLSELIQDFADKIEVDPSETIDPETLEKLERSAAKWYRGEGSVHDGAEKYYHMNMVEKRAVELAFPDAIFVTFNGSEFRCLFPDHMPIFYMYSLKKGFGVKPWFLSGAAAPHPQAAQAQHAV